jgi:hypothetical protein
VSAQDTRQSSTAAPLQRGSDEAHSNFADAPLTKLWQDAGDRETGAEAVEEIRARQREQESKRRGKRDR